jgi:signal peptidase II
MAALALAVLAADQVSKSLVLAAQPAAGTGTGWVSIRLVRNTGASGGIASGYPVLVTLAAIGVTAIAAAFALHARSRAAALCLAAVLGGAAGNLSDRIFRAPGFGRGGVVDWIHFGPGGGSMDVADLAIQFGVLGAVIAIIASGRVRKAGQAAEARASADDRCRLPGLDQALPHDRQALDDLVQRLQGVHRTGHVVPAQVPDQPVPRHREGDGRSRRGRDRQLVPGGGPAGPRPAQGRGLSRSGPRQLPRPDDPAGPERARGKDRHDADDLDEGVADDRPAEQHRRGDRDPPQHGPRLPDEARAVGVHLGVARDAQVAEYRDGRGN